MRFTLLMGLLFGPGLTVVTVLLMSRGESRVASALTASFPWWLGLPFTRRSFNDGGSLSTWKAVRSGCSEVGHSAARFPAAKSYPWTLNRSNARCPA